MQTEIINIEIADFDDEGTTVAVTAYDGNEERNFYLQTCEGKTSSPDCWILTDDYDGDIDIDDFPSFDFELMANEAEDFLAEEIKFKKIQDIKDSDIDNVITRKAEKITSLIGGKFDDYIILANTISNAETIDVNNTMIMLQVTLDCTQEQSQTIIDICKND